MNELNQKKRKLKNETQTLKKSTRRCKYKIVSRNALEFNYEQTAKIKIRQRSLSFSLFFFFDINIYKQQTKLIRLYIFKKLIDIKDYNHFVSIINMQDYNHFVLVCKFKKRRRNINNFDLI